MKLARLCILSLSTLTAFALFPANAQAQTLRFQCEDGKSFLAEIRNDEAKLRLDSGKSMTLLPIDAREGVKFANGNTELSINGTQASVEMNWTPVLTQCVSQESSSTLSSN